MTTDNQFSALEQPQAWYHSNCDGDWEHQFGFSLETLDNPGWRLTLDLDDTRQQDQAFTDFNIHNEDELNWITLKRDGTKLRGTCGPMQLGQMLEIVANWVHPRSL